MDNGRRLVGSIRARRWARVDRTLRNICAKKQLAGSVTRETSWLLEVTHIDVVGDRDAITALKWAIESMARDGDIEWHPQSAP